MTQFTKPTEASESESLVRTRLVFVFPGFEPLKPDAYLARFRRAAERSASVFGAKLGFRERRGNEGGSSASGVNALTAELGTVLTSGGGQVVETDLVFCVWDDLIAAYGSRSLVRRVWNGFAALFSFLVNGTFLRYCKTSWRYAAFFLFPLVLAAAILVFGVLLAVSLGSLFTGPTTWSAGILIGSAATAILFFAANRQWHLLTALDDWSLARDLCERSNPDIETRIRQFADILKIRASSGRPDEIVIAAHSLGASFAVPALAIALLDGLAPRVPLHVLTVGSSLMKTALHPGAKLQREAVRRITVDHGVPWTDCQALSDPINFYKSNPATSLGIAADPAPFVIKLRLRHMVSEDTYRRIKRDFFRLHRQFVLAVERRCPYSFHMLLLGPATMDAFRKHRTVNRSPLVEPKRNGPLSEDTLPIAPTSSEGADR